MSAPSSQQTDQGSGPLPTLEDAKQPSAQSPLPRAAGILLHPTSLPGPHGIGDLGAAAYRFVEVLEAARQTIWQLMPLGPVGLGNSPYAASSAFAGFPLLIALDQLTGRGWLDRSDLDAPELPPAQVQFDAVAEYKTARLKKAFERFEQRASGDDTASLEAFQERHRAWLDDYALFMALKDAHMGAGWMNWDRPLALRQGAALAQARRDLAADVRFHQWVQWVFFEQWTSVRTYANDRGITIVGDIPIFVAWDSADVWVHREQFQMDDEQPTAVAGVPPDAFSKTGQRWGNPLYDWDRMAATGYRWWLDRFKATLELVDTVRLDHFRGFAAYWRVPADEETAINGRWVPGPGKALFEAIDKELGHIPMIVEDLGEITPDVIVLREALGFPGMKVLQFAFGDDAHDTPRGQNPYLPHNYEPNCAVYTGTHDNDTTVGWFASLSPEERASVLRYVGTDGSRIARDLTRLAYQSVAAVAVIPLQDVLELGPEARMNVPGRPEHNWTWRYQDGVIQPRHTEWLAALTASTARWRSPDAPATDEKPEDDEPDA
ncbi:MAG TPA: 4-alpha-glucanotransferase [Chloroflexota bacterium]|nr:4-alpha-glucanotransferase [Chloroflexota bacterium]